MYYCDKCGYCGDECLFHSECKIVKTKDEEGT